MAKRKKVDTKPRVAADPVENWTIFRHIAWWSLLTMVFVTPIIISNWTFLGFQMPISYDQFDIIKVFCQRVFTFVALAAWLWDLMLRGGKIRRTPVDWLILAFLAWVTVSTIFSIHPATAFFGKYRRFEGLASFINYAVIYFLILQFADRPSRVRRLAQTLFWSGVVVAGYGVLQSLGKDFLQWGQLPFELNRAFSTYGNPDLLGGFLMFSTFISIGLALAEQRLVWRGVYWFGFLLNAWCVVVAFTRSAWVGFAAGMVIMIVLAVVQRTEWKAEDYVFGGLTALAAGTVISRSLSNPNVVMNFGARLKSIFEFGEGSAKTRFQIWSAAIDATKDRPLFGFGPDTFRLVFPKYKPVEYVKDAGYLSVADNVHNYPLQLMAGIGLPGMLMLYSIFGWAAWRSAPLVFNREGGSNRMILAGFWTACAAYITHLFFGLSVTGSSFLLWTCMAVVLAPTATFIEIKRPVNWGIPIAAVVSALALAGIANQVIFMQADYAYLQSRVGFQGAARTAWAQKAVQLNPYNDMYRAEVGLSYTDEFLSTIQQISSGQGDQTQLLNTAQVAFKAAESSLKDTIAFVPSEYDNYVFISNLYNLAGQIFGPSYYEESIKYANEGIKVEPYGPAIRFQLARALIETKRTDEAIKQLAYAHKMDPAYYEVTGQLAQLYEQKGDIASAVRVLKETNDYRPGLPGIAEALQRLESSSTTAP